MLTDHPPPSDISGPAHNLSVIVPVYDEAKLVEQSLQRVRDALPGAEIVAVDDCSKDGSGDLLRRLRDAGTLGLTLVEQPVNQGKGAAVRAGLAAATRPIVVIHDADLEYDPTDLPTLLALFDDPAVEAVYGSRYLSGTNRGLGRVHTFGNRCLTLIGNIVSGLGLTDMETCYKMIRRPVFTALGLRENRFGLEPEVTLRLAARGVVVREVPIRYDARAFDEGKKIGMRDLFRTLWVLFRLGWIALPVRMVAVTLLAALAVAVPVIALMQLLAPA